LVQVQHYKLICCCLYKFDRFTAVSAYVDKYGWDAIVLRHLLDQHRHVLWQSVGLACQVDTQPITYFLANSDTTNVVDLIIIPNSWTTHESVPVRLAAVTRIPSLLSWCFPTAAAGNSTWGAVPSARPAVAVEMAVGVSTADRNFYNPFTSDASRDIRSTRNLSVGNCERIPNGRLATPGFC
jgi:hypothetical protein